MIERVWYELDRMDGQATEMLTEHMRFIHEVTASSRRHHLRGQYSTGPGPGPKAYKRMHRHRVMLHRHRPKAPDRERYELRCYILDTRQSCGRHSIQSVLGSGASTVTALTRSIKKSGIHSVEPLLIQSSWSEHCDVPAEAELRRESRFCMFAL
jgi:hypothetical protein